MFLLIYYLQPAERSIKQEPIDQGALPQLPVLSTTGTGSPDSPPQGPHKKSALSFLFEDDDVTITQVIPALSLQERAHMEVESYKREERIASGQNPLVFWKGNKEKYPLLAPFARKLLSTQGSSVPSERVFSTAGDIVTPTRACLDPELVDKLLFLKKNMKEQDKETYVTSK